MGNRELLTFPSRDAWREWLKTNHDKETEAWLVLYKKGAREVALSLDEAVEEALCYGWIDGKAMSFDHSRYTLRFTPRKPGSMWSISNIRRVEKLIGEDRMTEAGLEKVVEAQQNGQWDVAIRIEQTDLIPDELEKALRREKGALAAYRKLAHSRKKQLLHWLLTAKMEDTRQRRIAAIVEEVSE